MSDTLRYFDINMKKVSIVNNNSTYQTIPL